MYKSNLLFVAIFGLFYAAQGSILIPEACSDKPVVQNISTTDYLGSWYEIEKYPSVFEVGGICQMANYGLNDDGTIFVYNTMILEATGELDAMNGTARFNSTDGSAKLAVNFPSTGPAEAPYWVLDTDYVNYSVVWSCRDFLPNVSQQTTWFLSRTPSPTPVIRKKVYDLLESLNISIEKLNVTPQYCYQQPQKA